MYSPMNISYAFKNMSDGEKQGFYDYFDKKIDKIEKIAALLYGEPSLDVHAEKFVKNSAYKVSLRFHGSPDVMVSEDDHTITEAIDLAEGKLVERLRKLKDKMRS